MAIVYINQGEIYKTEELGDTDSLFMRSLDKFGNKSFYYRDKRLDPITDFVGVKRSPDTKEKRQKYYKSTQTARSLAGIKRTNQSAANIRNTVESDLFDMTLALGYYKGDVEFEEVYYHLENLNKLEQISQIINLANPLNPELINEAMNNKQQWRYGNIGGVDIMVCSIVYSNKVPTMFKVYNFGN